MGTKINFAQGKNGGYIPSSLGGRSISVGRQAAGRQAGRQAGQQTGRQARPAGRQAVR